MRILLIAVCISSAVACGPVKSEDDILSEWGKPCSVETTSVESPHSEIWHYCVINAGSTEKPTWRLTTCYSGCASLEFTMTEGVLVRTQAPN